MKPLLIRSDALGSFIDLTYFYLISIAGRHGRNCFYAKLLNHGNFIVLCREQNRVRPTESFTISHTNRNYTSLSGFFESCNQWRRVLNTIITYAHLFPKRLT